MADHAPDLDLIWLRKDRQTSSRRPALSRKRIVEAAIELADKHGLDAVSSRAIAAQLKAGPTSMYWHVKSQADLFELMYDEVLGELVLPSGPSRNWRADLTALARGTLEVFSRHPWLALLGIQPGIGPNSRRYGEFSIAVLADVGLNVDTSIQAVAILNNYVLGFAHRRAAWHELKRRSGLGRQWEQRLDRYIAQTASIDPALAEYIKTRYLLTSDENFEQGLACVLDGLADRFVHSSVRPKAVGRKMSPSRPSTDH